MTGEIYIEEALRLISVAPSQDLGRPELTRDALGRKCLSIALDYRRRWWVEGNLRLRFDLNLFQKAK